jgi:hypothetical protein
MTGPNTWTDGNALAGPLQQFFSVELTAAIGRCDGCGRTGPLAESRVFDHAPGLVARCPNCDRVLLRMVQSPDRAWLDLRGLSYLQLVLEP